MIEEAEEAFSKKGEAALSEEQITELKERAQAGFHRLREYYEDVGERVRDRYSDAEERLRDYYEEMETRLRSGVDTTDQTLRTHPYQMAAATFGLGLALGILIRMSRSE